MLRLQRVDTDTLRDEWDELFPEDDVPIRDSMDVTQRIQSITLLEQQMAQLDKQDQESRMFYAAKKAKCQERIENVKRCILGWLQLNRLKNISTPAGTAYQKTITVKSWPDDEALLAWATDTPSLIRVKKEPDKRLMADHIKATGECPPGYSESQETRVYIR